MAHLSNSSADKKKHIVHGGKGRQRPSGRSEYAAEEHQRKHSLDAYYRPRHRGFIEACLRDADETETDLPAGN